MTSVTPAVDGPTKSRLRIVLGMLWRDKFATAAVIFLLIAILCAILGPALLGEAATKQNLRGRNAPPFTLEQGWLMFLGADALGRPLLARIIVAAQNTLMIAAGAVALSATIGAALGLVAGYGPRWAGTAIMRLADVIMSLPVAAARGDRALHAVAVGRERDPRARDHPHPDLPAHHPRRGAGDQGADVRAGGAGDGRLVACASSSATSCRW